MPCPPLVRVVQPCANTTTVSQRKQCYNTMLASRATHPSASCSIQPCSAASSPSAHLTHRVLSIRGRKAPIPPSPNHIQA